MTQKSYKIPGDAIEQLIPESGACFATDRIMVDGLPVGYMYREPPDNPSDSGWRFFAGDESNDYMDNPANTGIFSVNTVANYDREIIPLIRKPIGSAFAREGSQGELIPVESPIDPDDCLHPDFPVVHEEYQLTDRWSMVLPCRFNRRIEEGALVLWRPGFTIYVNLLNNDQGKSVDDLVTHFKSAMSPDAQQVEDRMHDGVRQLSYRLQEDAVHGFYGFKFVPDGVLHLTNYFDNEEDEQLAREIFTSVRCVTA